MVSIETLGSIGEDELLNRLAKYAPIGQLDDDTAILNLLSPTQLVVNSDVFVESVHFSDLTTRPEDIGWRIIAATLSDLAATGCNKVIGVTISMVAPAKTSWDWVEKVYTGLSSCLESYGGILLGGDCSGGKEKILAVTALGSVSTGKIHRNDARPGDWIVVSGPHGLSRLGLAILQNEVHDRSISFVLRQQAIQAHRRPKPRFDIIRVLDEVRPKDIPWRIAGTDSSDGLFKSIQLLAKASFCHAIVNQAELPFKADMIGLDLQDKSQWVLHGGEDFELVLSLPPSWGKALLHADSQCKKIGIMVAEGSILEQPDSVNSWISADNFFEFKHF
ncbi:MAG TPA: thiamine-phosphate kinase [Prochlorococcaceae cyanobacterium AMR_MDS_5431]|nr:thiamine-phosphate kinase [Prochlorococcaceae cyanobacterium AMR_MDS_5431]